MVTLAELEQQSLIWLEQKRSGSTTEKKILVFAKTFAKLSYFRQDFFAKTKIKFRENFREKNEIKNFRPHPNELCCKTTSFSRRSDSFPIFLVI
jgi:hypothetical protein